MFHLLAALANRWARFVILVGVIVAVVGVMYATGVGGSLTTDNGFTVKGSQSDNVASTLSQDFKLSPTSAVILFTTRDGELVTSSTIAAEIQRVVAPLAAQSTRLVTAYNGPTTTLISRDRRSTYAVVTLTGSAKEQYAKLTNWQNGVESSLINFEIGGEVVGQHQSQDQVEHDLSRAELISLPILAVLLLIFFRSVVAALLPLTLGVLAIIWGIAITRLLTHVTAVDQYALNVVTLLGLGLSVDYSLLMVNRFREELGKLSPSEPADVAVRRTVLTSGRTIFFSGLTVIVSLLSLLVFPIGFLHSISLGGASAIAMAVIAALVVLPALLQLIGRNIDRLSLPRRSPKNPAETFWQRLGHLVGRYPWVAIGASVVVIIALAAPLAHIMFVTDSYRFLPTASSSREVGAALANNFPAAGYSLDVVYSSSSNLQTPAGTAALKAAKLALMRVPHVTDVTLGAAPRETEAYFMVTTSNDDTTARVTVSDIRALKLTSGSLTVGGTIAALSDSLTSIGHRLPIAGLIIAVSMMILLGLLVRSVVIPLQAIIINSFALLAAMGILVFVFQDGHFTTHTWLSETVGLDPTIPILIFAIAFGLSMDYGSFLYSRMREFYDRGDTTETAIVQSLSHTGGIITAAAILLVVVVGAFGSSSSAFIQQVGIGLSSAVIVDAFVVRLFLVPAVMHQFGRLNWYAPKWMQRWQIRHE